LKPEKKVEIEVDYTTYKTRSYRVSGERIQAVLGVKPLVGVKEAVEHMIRQIDEHHQMDLYSPRYYNIEWMTHLSDMEQTLKRIGGVFRPSSPSSGARASSAATWWRPSPRATRACTPSPTRTWTSATRSRSAACWGRCAPTSSSTRPHS